MLPDGPLWPVADQCSAAFALSLCRPRPSPSPARRSSSSALSFLPPVSLCGSSTTGGIHLRLPRAAEKDMEVKELGMNECRQK